MAQDTILQVLNVTKRFGGVTALDEATLEVRRNEIHALMGENGAGKSTMMKVLSGVYPFGEYGGDIIFNGETAKFKNIKDSTAAGIAIIYQELTLVKELDICDNLFLGYEIANKGVINKNEQYQKTTEILKKVNLNVNPMTKVRDLSIAQQQLVEIAKALLKNSQLLILDEPTAALTEEETGILLDLVKDLKRQGMTCIYISHKQKEVFRIADRVTVLRDGKTIITKGIKDIDERELIESMVGRSISQQFVYDKAERGDVLLEVKDWTLFDADDPSKKIISNANFMLRSGEVVGIAGLMGSGRTELCMSIFGAMPGKTQGKIILEGREIVNRRPSDAIKNGISYLSEDRKRYGLILEMSILKNCTIASLYKYTKYGVINDSREIKECNGIIDELRIKAAGIDRNVSSLSGGNQQKVSLAKWLLTSPKVMILDEPTRGIDVGAKYEIYGIVNELKKTGVGIIFVSSELPEVIGVSDRILVMGDGQIKGELLKEEANQEKIAYMAIGG